MPCVGAGGGEAARQPDDAALGGGVGEVVGSPSSPVDVVMHDAAVALLDDVRPRGAGGVERAADVHGEVPRRGPRASTSGKPAHRMIPALLTSDVDAPELLDRRVDERLAPPPRWTRRCVSATASPPAAAISATTAAAGSASAPVALHRAAEVVDDDARRRASASRRA